MSAERWSCVGKQPSLQPAKFRQGTLSEAMFKFVVRSGHYIVPECTHCWFYTSLYHWQNAQLELVIGFRRLVSSHSGLRPRVLAFKCRADFCSESRPFEGSQWNMLQFLYYFYRTRVGIIISCIQKKYLRLLPSSSTSTRVHILHGSDLWQKNPPKHSSLSVKKGWTRVRFWYPQSIWSNLKGNSFTESLSNTRKECRLCNRVLRTGRHLVGDTTQCWVLESSRKTSPTFPILHSCRDVRRLKKWSQFLKKLVLFKVRRGRRRLERRLLVGEWYD